MAAERIRSVLDENISSLVEELILPSNSADSMQSSDADAAYSLFRALQIQSCELIGQLLVLIRSLVVRYAAELASLRKAASQQTQKDGVDKYYQSLKQKKLQDYRQVGLLNGVMLLCRLSWLLRSSSGNFLSRALTLSVDTRSSSSKSSTSSRSTNSHHHYYHQYMTSLEQLQSAFDIADTDGDGLVTFPEAVEAVSALWIDKTTSSQDDSSSGPPSLDFLWFDAAGSSSDALLPLASSTSEGSSSNTSPNSVVVVPPGMNFTFNEFRLVCSQMIPPPVAAAVAANTTMGQTLGEEDSPANSLKQSLDRLIFISLSVWSSTILDLLKRDVRASLRQDFPISSSVPVHDSSLHSLSVSQYQKVETWNSFVNCPTFKLTWTVKEVSLDVGDDDGGSTLQERVGVPTSLSASLFKYLYVLQSITHSSALSADTTQSLPYPFIVPADERRVLPDIIFPSSHPLCLWNLFENVMFLNGARIIVEELTSWRVELSEIVSKTSKNKPTPTAVMGRTLHPEWFQQLFEDYALQIVFDLMICEKTLLLLSVTPSTDDCRDDVSNNNSLSIRNQFDECVMGWSDVIDPINIQLVNPLVEEHTAAFMKRGNLLLPCSDYHREDGTRSEMDPSGGRADISDHNSAEKEKDQDTSVEFLQKLFAADWMQCRMGHESERGNGGSTSPNKSSGVGGVSGPPRFTLLPLPVNIGSTGALRKSASSNTQHQPQHGSRSGQLTASNSSSPFKDDSAAVANHTRGEASGAGVGGGLSSVFKGFKGW